MKLKELRKSKGLTQNDIVRMLNIPQTTYSNYEVGIHEPDIKTLIKFADFFNVSLDYLTERNYKEIDFSKLSPESYKLINEILTLTSDECKQISTHIKFLKDSR